MVVGAFSVTNIRVDLPLKLYHLHVTFVTRCNQLTRVGDCRGRTTELWRPANYSQFWGKTLEDGVGGRLGAAWPQPPVSEDTATQYRITWPKSGAKPRQGDTASHVKWSLLSNA